MKSVKNLNMAGKFCFITLVAALFLSCGEDDVNTPHGSAQAPQKVTVDNIINYEGMSVVYFSLPDDKNLKYVKAEWTTDDGVAMNTTASFYTDSVVIQGFKDACTADVKIYSVSSGDVYSEPATAQVSPKRPPYLTASENMVVSPYFLGLKILAQNSTGARLSIYMYRENTKTPDGWEEIGQYHSSATILSCRVGKQDTVETKFAVRIKDNFNHWSDYKTSTFTPMWETECDRLIFAECQVHRIDPESGEPVFDAESTDWDGHQMHSWSGSNVAFNKLWDDEKMKSAASCYHTKPSGTKLPQSFCIDLGKAYTLSRAMVWPRASDTRMGGSGDDWQHVYKGGMPKHVRIYGARYTGDDPKHNLPDDISDPTGWILLGDDYFRQADGSVDPITSGVGSEDNRLVLEAGFEVEFEDPGTKIRYVRFQTIELYGAGTSAVMLSEIEFYGSDK